jgi:radical SAM protein with 4Fe4S-binding SPASM domain
MGNLMNKGKYDKGNTFLSINTDLKQIDLFHRVSKLRQEFRNGLNASDNGVLPEVIYALSDHANPWPIQQHVLMEASRQSDESLLQYLCARFRYDFFPKRKHLEDYPPCLQIEPSSICNFRCVFCFQTDKTLTSPKNGHMGQISADIFRKIVDEIEGNIQFLTLASRGEPLLNKQIPEMLNYAKGKFLGLKINTNASKLTPEYSRLLLESELSTIVFSVDAGEKDVYESLRINGKYEVVMDNISKFNEIKANEFPNSKVLTRVSGVLFDEKIQDVQVMHSAWSKLVDQVAFVSYLPWENPYKTEPNNIESACSDLWRRMFIWWDGRANPCDVDYLSWLSVGNITNSSVADLWNSQGYENLRRRHLGEERQGIAPCSSCFLI